MHVDFDTMLLKMGQNLQRARWRRGMTQQEVAAHGITYRYYQELERGDRNPTLRTLYELCAILGVRVVDLLEVGDRRHAVDLAKVTAEPPPRGRKPRNKKKRSARR
jgi:transcriptional regulator with XRE-family HTH domain